MIFVTLGRFRGCRHRFELVAHHAANPTPLVSWLMPTRIYPRFGQPQLAIAVSRPSVLGCRAGPLRRGDQHSLERFDSFFTQSDLLWQELSPAVVDLATTLRVKTL